MDESDNLVQNSVHVGTPAQIPGIELESEIEVPGSAVTMMPENSDAEMEAAAANAGFTNVPAASASTAVDIIVIDDDTPDDDAVATQECKVEPSDVDIINPIPINPAPEDSDVSDKEGVNPAE